MLVEFFLSSYSIYSNHLLEQDMLELVLVYLLLIPETCFLFHQSFQPPSFFSIKPDLIAFKKNVLPQLSQLNGTTGYKD